MYIVNELSVTLLILKEKKTYLALVDQDSKVQTPMANYQMRFELYNDLNENYYFSQNESPFHNNQIKSI